MAIARNLACGGNGRPVRSRTLGAISNLRLLLPPVPCRSFVRHYDRFGRFPKQPVPRVRRVVRRDRVAKIARDAASSVTAKTSTRADFTVHFALEKALLLLLTTIRCNKYIYVYIYIRIAMLTVILTGLGSRLTRPVNSHLDRFGVSGDLRRRCRHCYR